MDRTFHIVTFGCQMNKLDSELLQAALQSRGFTPVEEPGKADIVIYNTCSVRQHAEDRVLSHLGTWRRRAQKDPGFIVAVIGCMAQRLGRELTRRFPHVRLVCGTDQLLNVPDYLERLIGAGGRVVALERTGRVLEGLPARRPASHHAYVSVMRGCDRFCAYCIVPYVRGRQRSRRPEEVIEEVRRLCDEGVVEVTLLGQNVSAYGKDLGDNASLALLLERVNDLSGLRRIRFLTSHPADVDAGLLRRAGELEKVCEHIHMPAQSGSNAVLARMNRGYTRERYLRLVQEAREVVPQVEFSSDFIVGFPGESDSDFEQTLGLLRQVRFQQSFIFSYSPRPGTRAARWPDDVPAELKRRRHRQLLAAQQEIDAQRRGGLLGVTVEVMSEGWNRADPATGECIGRTRQNDIVVFGGRYVPPGALCRVRLEGCTALTLFGHTVNG